VGSPPLLRRPAASGGGFVALLAVPVAVAVAGLAVVATLQGPHAGPAPGVDQAAALRARVAAAPQDATAWAELGTLVLRQAADTGDPRRYPDADAALGRSLQLRPDGNAAALGGLAALRTVQRRYAEAQDLARRALALDPNDPAVWGTLADAASGLGRYDESRVAVGHMLERQADVAALTRSAALDETFGRVDAARATLERAVGAAASPAETAQAHAALADLAFAGGDPAEAYRRIRLARTADPDDPNLLAAQATAEAALGMTPAALADYTTAVDSAAPLVDTAPGAASGPPGPAAAATPDAAAADPAAAPATAAHASSAATAGAAAAADTAAPSTPASDAAAAGTAAAPGDGTGPPHAATAGTADHATTAAAAATPDAAAENPTAHAAGGAGSPMAPDAVGGAAARAAAGLAVGGRRTVAPRYLAAAGELFEAVGRPGDARRAYASFTAMASLYATNGVPRAPEPALFAADRGDAAQALRLAEAALRTGPTPAAQDAYAWALMANGRAAEAVTWSDKATSAGARNALFAFHRGMIESSLGRDGAAIDDLATALRTNPWFSPRLAPLARVTLTALSGLQ
jgi:tetratricopeptide (TPR) repeat protein